MEDMWANAESWIPNKFKPNLMGMIERVGIKIKKYIPFGTDGTHKDVAREEKEYKGLCYRIDIVNRVGTNFKK